MTAQNPCYGPLISIPLKVVAVLSDLLPARLFVYLWYLSAALTLATKFAIVKVESFIRGRPLPPAFNKRFETPLVGVKPTRVRWIAEAPQRRKTDPVILYYHGGGYGVAMQTPQISSLCDLYFRVDNPRLSILALEYTTSAYAQYPTQLREAAEVYNGLTNTSSNIILLGDSAGGQLGLQLMRHSVDPELSVARVTQKPSAYLGISPAVDLNACKDMSSHPNSRYDILSVPIMQVWPQWISKEELVRNGRIMRLQLDTKTHWDAALPPPGRVFISYGGHEILRDSIKGFIEDTGLDKKGAVVYSHPLDFHASLCYVGSASPVMKPAVEFLRSLLSNDAKT